MIDLKELIKAGVQFGHQKNRWCPKMAPYIWGTRGGVHLINVYDTATQLEKSAKFLQGIAAQGKQILWVGTKKAAQDAILHAAKDQMPYVSHRWIGGTLSNNLQVKKSVTKYLHLLDVIAKAEKVPFYTKKEINTFQKQAERLKKNVGGITHLKWPLGAIVLVDVLKERSALREASIAGVPVVGLVDTNSDPTLVDYVIPANDDSPRSVGLIINYLSKAVDEGHKVAEKKAAEAKEAAEKERAAKKEEAAAVRAKTAKRIKTTDKKAEAAPKKTHVKAPVKKDVAAKKVVSATTKEAPKATTKKKADSTKKVAAKKETVKKKTEK